MQHDIWFFLDCLIDNMGKSLVEVLLPQVDALLADFIEFAIPQMSIRKVQYFQSRGLLNRNISLYNGIHRRIAAGQI